jgi:hypothetical protein
MSEPTEWSDWLERDDREHWERREPQPVEDTASREPWPEPTEAEAVDAWSQTMTAMVDAEKQPPPGLYGQGRKEGPPIVVVRDGTRTTSWRVRCRECDWPEIDGKRSWTSREKAHEAATEHARVVHQWAARIVTDEEDERRTAAKKKAARKKSAKRR